MQMQGPAQMQVISPQMQMGGQQMQMNSPQVQMGGQVLMQQRPIINNQIQGGNNYL